MKKSFTRTLALLLCVVMLVGLMPVGVLADSTKLLTAAIFFSDVHEESTGTSGSGTTAMKNVLATIGQNGVSYETIGFVGDTYSDKAGTMANMTSAAQGALGQTIPCYYAYGDHDEESDIGPDSGLMYTGNYYYIYHISDANMRSGTASQSSVSYSDAITNFKNAAASWDKTKILFIMSHVPLHDRRDDNTYANDWYTAITKVAETMDVVVFWAHNHTSEDDVDRAAYYVAKDGSETMTIYNGSTITPNFTYMNAGYIYAAGQDPSRKGVATTVEIYADSMVFQDYNSSGKYTDSSYSHNVTVAREFAVTKTLSSLAVSGTTEYYVGDSFVAPTVTAVYSDSSTVTLTAQDYEVSGTYDMNTAGTYTLTYTYEGMTGTYTFAVEPNYVSSIAVTTQPTKVSYLTTDTALDTTGMVVTATYANGTTAAVTGYTLSDVDFTTAGEETVTVSYTEDGTTVTTTFTVTVEEAPEVLTLQKIEITTPPTKTEYLVSEELVLDGMVVTATFLNESDETVTQEIAYKPFSTSAVYGGYELDNFSMYVEKNHEMVVTYTYGVVTCTDTTTINVWNEDFTDEDTSVKVYVTGDYGVTGISVADSENTNVATAIAGVISGDNYKAYDISLTFDEGYETTNATKTVTLPIPEGVNNPVVYYVPTSGDAQYMTITEKTDTTVTFETTHFSTYVVGESSMTGTEDTATVPGYSVTTYTPVAMTVYKLVATPESGKTYLIVNSATGTGYGLDGDTTGYATTAFTGGDGYYSSYDESAQSGTAFSVGSDVYLTTDGAYLWTAGSNSFTIGYSSSSSVGLGTTSYTYTLDPDNSTTGTWSLSSNKLSISLTTTDSWFGSDTNTTYYLTNSGSDWSMSTSGSNVYFYEPVTIYTLSETTTGTQTATYGMYITYPDADGNYVDTQQAITAQGVLPNETLQLGAVFTSTVDGQTPPSDGTWTITSSNTGIATVDNAGVVTFTGEVGETLIQATYTWEQDGVTYSVSNYVAITTTAPDHYTIELHYANLTQVASDATFDSTATYYVFNSTTNVYEKVEITAFEDGVTYYTTPVKQGDEITSTIALKGIEAGDRYPIWAVVKAYATADDDTGTDLGELGDALYWSVSDESIATIDTATGVLTFTGTNYGTFTVTVSYTGADGKVITDTITISATESMYVVPGDGTNDFPEYPNEGAVRFDKTATAVGNFSETGIAQVEISMTGVPYSTGSEIDVVLMLDITGSMKDVTDSSYTEDDVEYYTRIYSTVEAAKAFARAIVINEDGSYNGNRIGIYSFNSGGNNSGSGNNSSTSTIDSGATYVLHELSAITDIDALDDEIDTFINNYATGGTPYAKALSAIQSTLAAAKTDGTGNDRQQFAVFMTDGCPTTYKGTSTDFVSASDIQGMFTGTDYNTRDTDYEYEYYSTAMKAAGVTVYTVGLGLNNTNSAWSDSSATQCYNAASILLNDISGPANEASQPDALSTTTLSKKDTYFFSVDDADAASQMGSVFKNIAQKIVEAAKDVVVEDKIGNNYSINLALPYGVTTDETDGLNEFYIQVVEYQLDSNKERTGDPYVKEKFLFNADGSIKSHTVDGTVTCEGTACTHITQSKVTKTYTETNEDGTTTSVDYTTYVTTAINGTYFTYVSNDDGEILTWNEDKISTTELALQYFAHLDNSSDAVGTNSEIPAGTYYTNEYATLTYTNYNGNQVQQEFPVPQMTWNGAQVSYVFYLVNEAGQPVNRAGRVVPFAEAEYVTDVYTYAIIWNSLEQSAGLEADYLAEQLVPDAYALYDDDAEYFIHVYEDEEKDNLNNHFTIGGDVTDDYNTTTHSWTNAKTTYVFNTKADATKYNTVGTYINSDGTATDVTTYLCKGDGTVTATIEQVTVADATAFAAGTYFVLNDSGKYVQAALYDANATYYAITSASYTAASGETQAKAADMESTSGATVIDGYLYYIDENNAVYTIVQKSNGTEVETGFDFHNTTVAFAVVWKPELVEDTVVVDYGLDVVIDVITNDNMAAGVVGVRTDAPSGITMNSGNYNAAKATSVDVEIGSMKIGTATVENLNAVRFSLDKTNGMQFTDPAVFYYEADVNYYESNNALKTTSMYSKVTVIPAATIYYEDEYATLKTFTVVEGTTTIDANTQYDEATGWDSNSAANGVQDADRPGESKISDDLDADNVYGYDSAYEAYAKYSFDSAAKVSVYSGKYATAEFSFCGTGFDIISATSNLTGIIFVKVTDDEGNVLRNTMVDTYYGYTKDETTGEWVVVENSAEETVLYQIPVIKISDLEYGKYNVKITASYSSYFDHNTADTGYTLYLDAIRIYDPTGVISGVENSTVSNAYKADGEMWPSYLELRNKIIEASTYKEDEDGNVTDADFVKGAIFIDGVENNKSVADYVSYGPNNEVYLSNGQSVAFTVSDTENLKSVQLGIKSADGTTVGYSIYNTTTDGTASNKQDFTVKTSTDMYYDITDWKNSTIVITNNGTGILSLTNIKFTYTADPNGTATASDDSGSGSSGSSSGSSEASAASTEESGTAYIYMTRAAVAYTLEALNAPEVEEETTEPEIPEVEEPTEPEVPAEPETPAEPEVFEPEVFRVKLDNAKGKLGKVLKLTITTSDDVEKVIVNGVEAREGRSDRKTGLTTWTVNIKAQDIGELTISAIAYNAMGIGSEPVEIAVSIDAPHSNPGHSKWEPESNNR